MRLARPAHFPRDSPRSPPACRRPRLSPELHTLTASVPAPAPLTGRARVRSVAGQHGVPALPRAEPLPGRPCLCRVPRLPAVLARAALLPVHCLPALPAHAGAAAAAELPSRPQARRLQGHGLSAAARPLEAQAGRGARGKGRWRWRLRGRSGRGGCRLMGCCGRSASVSMHGISRETHIQTGTAMQEAHFHHAIAREN